MHKKLASTRLCLLLTLALAAAGGAVAQPGATNAESAFAEAFALYDAGLYAEAARAFEAFGTRYPDHTRQADALYYQARSELAAGRDERAARLLQWFRHEHPTHPLAGQARLVLGEYYFAAGDYDLATTALRDALDGASSPEEEARAMLMIGQASLNAGHYDAGIVELRLVADTHPRADAAPRALYAMGAAAMEHGDYTTAADAFSRLATRYRRTPEDHMVGLALVEALLRTGQLRRVEDEVQRRLADLPSADLEGGLPLAPSVAEARRDRRDRAHFLAGEAALRLGETALARDHFSRVRPEGALGPRAVYGLGRAAFALEEWGTAAELLDRVAAASTERLLRAEALYYAGMAYRRAGQLDAATDRLAQAARAAPDGALADVALFEQGMLLYTTRRWDEAVPVFQRVLDEHVTSPHAGEAARMLAETYAAMGDYRQAEAATALAQELGAVSPDLAIEVEFQRGYRALHAGQLHEAEELLAGVHAAGAAGERAGEALFWAGEAAFQLGQAGQRAAFARAVERFDRFLQRFPDHRQRDAARYALAWSHFKRGDYGAAAAAFERFLASYRPGSEIVPYTADARLRLADSYFALRRWDDAVRAYRQVEGAGSDYATFQTGQAHANAGRTAEAAAAYSRLLATYEGSPLRPQARYALGDLRFQAGDYDGAVDIFEEVIRLHPSSPIAARAQFAIGDARYNQGRMSEAAAAYRRVLERFPSSPLVPDAISALEIALGAIGRDDEVSRIIDAYEARNPGSAAIDELRLRQAESRFQRGEHHAAIADLRGLVSATRDPDVVPPALLYLGRAHVNVGDARSAESYFRRLVDDHPNSPLRGEALRRLGLLMVQQGRFAEALPLFNEAIDLSDSRSESMEARLGMAQALAGLGRHADAAPLLQAAIADAPSSSAAARARLQLAELHEQSGRGRAASELLEAIALEDDGQAGATAATRLARLLLQRDEAHSVLQTTDRLRVEERFAGYPDQVAEVLLQRARALRRLGQSGRADEVYDRIVRAYPETPAAGEARRERDV